MTVLTYLPNKEMRHSTPLVKNGSRSFSDWRHPDSFHDIRKITICIEKKVLPVVELLVVERHKSFSRMRVPGLVHCRRKKSSVRVLYHPVFSRALLAEKQRIARGAVSLPVLQVQAASKDCLSGYVPFARRCCTQVYPGRVPLFVSGFGLPASLSRVAVQVPLLFRRRTSRRDHPG